MNALPSRGALFDRHAAAVRRDDPLDQAQAEPGALHLRGHDIGGAIERLEDPRLIRGVDPDAAVGDRHADLRSDRRGADAESTRRRRRT